MLFKRSYLLYYKQLRHRSRTSCYVDEGKMKTNYDVVILGSGMSGTMTAAIVARQGRTVLVLDNEMHPRFAIGEATTPDISFRIKNLSLKYDVPEFLNLSTFHKLRDHVGPSSGCKRGFSFLYHREGQEPLPHESHQYPTLSPPMGPGCHFFRQETDAYLLSVAIQYGADVRQNTWVEAIDFAEEGVAIRTTDGVTVRARYVIDAAGAQSPLAEMFDLRASPDAFRTNSRGLYTHMLGVKLYDQVAGPWEVYGLKYPLSQGTLHHIFDGGWFWVIPFNNHPDAVNPLCSVGLVLDRTVYPETGLAPEDEFFHFVDQFPGIARQFERARAVREWGASDGRFQYASRQMTGPRYCLMPSAAAFIDPFFSSGINLTLSGIDILVRRLLRALATDDFSMAPFREIDAFFEANLAHYDDVISTAFVSFRSYDLWDAWYRVWGGGQLIATALQANLYMKYRETCDRTLFDRSEEPPYNRALGLAFPPFRAHYDQALAEMKAVRVGRRAPSAAAATIRALFEETRYIPSYWHWHDPSVRTPSAFTIGGMTRLYFWYFFHAPEYVRDHLFDWNVWTAYKDIYCAIRLQSQRSKRQRHAFIRDVFKAWNRDWVKG